MTAPALLTHRCTVPSFSAAKSPSAATSARVDVHTAADLSSALSMFSTPRSVFHRSAIAMHDCAGTDAHRHVISISTLHGRALEHMASMSEVYLNSMEVQSLP